MASQPKDFPDFDNMTNRVKDQVSDTANKAKENVQQAGRRAVDKIDEQREPSARALQNAASTLHQKADDLPGGEKVHSIAHAAADRMAATADYVREHDVNAMMGDVE